MLFLKNILFLFEGETVRYEANPNLNVEDQLRTLLPLRQLEAIRSSATTARKSLAKTLREQRLTLHDSREDQATLERRIEETRIRLAELQKAEAEPRARWTEAKLLLDKGRATEQQAQIAQQWRKSWQGFLREGRDLLGTPEESIQPLDVLRIGVQNLDLEIRREIAKEAHADGKASKTEESIAELDNPSASACPLCRQALTAEHRQEVLHELKREQMEAVELRKQCAIRLKGLESELDTFRRLLARCEELLSSKPTGNEEAPNLSSLEEDARQAEEALAVARLATDRAREELATAQEHLRLIGENAALEQTIVRAYRKDALLETLEAGMARFSAGLRGGIITPISDELRNQWKAFRPDAEWALSVDERGSLCLKREDQTLPYESMSGGEKMLSLLLFRLALTRALTKADFMLLDEPLEHLDPRSRRLLISTLHQVTKSGLIPQIIVTTYEESLARRLIARSQAHAVYL